NRRSSGVDRPPVETIDPTRSHAHITFTDTPAEMLGGAGEGEALLRRVQDRAAVLFAFEQVGGAQRSLQMARDYALERYAFGRPIGSFQAIKHKLAAVYVPTALARSTAAEGAGARPRRGPGLRVAAAAAGFPPGDPFSPPPKENTQAHGGGAYPWESACPLSARRPKLPSLALGTPRLWKDR